MINNYNLVCNYSWKNCNCNCADDCHSTLFSKNCQCQTRLL